MSKEKESPGPWRFRLLLCTLLSVALSLLVGIALYFFIIPKVVRSGIIGNTRLLEGSRLMDKWLHPTYKQTFSIYVYSVKNPDQFMSGEVPELSTSGPYVFDKKMEHKLISAEKGRVKYNRYQTYYFNESASCQTCILGNRVWVPNLIYQKFIEASSQPNMRAAATTLLSQTAFLEVEVGELLFEGYKDPFLDKVCEIPFMNFVCDSILDLPDRIGLFYEKNNTDDGVFEILDGTNDPSELGKIVSWDGKELLEDTWWSSKEARTIQGSDGSLLPPFISKGQRIYIFVAQLCRSVWLEFEKEVDAGGIPAYRFVMPASVFDYSLPENKGYCNPTDKIFFDSQNETGCWPNGMIDISQCLRGQPPIMITMPNFLFAGDEIKKTVKGLDEPNLDRDSITIDVEPRTGTLLRARRRSQVNIEMWKGKDEGIKFPVDLRKMKSTLMPVICVYEDVEIDSENLELIRSELINTEWWAYTLAKLMLIIGSMAVIGLISLFILKLRQQRRGKHSVVPIPNYQPNGKV